MTIEIFAVEIEAFEGTDLVYKIKAMDECAAEITISTAVNPDNWPEVSAAIGDALAMMFPPGRAAG
jgi:hypothetical protein